MASAADSFDLCITGGGATGAGCALEAQLRGLRTVLVEAQDFGAGTSSTSTKLVHGGVRYLQQAVAEFDLGQYEVVHRALRERRLMLQNAPHLARPLELLVPCYSPWQAVYYGTGLKMYDWLSGRASLFASRFLGRRASVERLPALKPDRLAGCIAYADGQFDDARYNLALVGSFTAAGGTALNHTRVTDLAHNGAGRLAGATLTDQLTGTQRSIEARAFINAAGPAADAIRAMAHAQTAPRLRLSKGVHILLPLAGWNSDAALMIPSTEDGRVIFAIPWLDRLLVGTTDTEFKPGDELALTQDEADYLLRHLNDYVSRPYTRADIVSGIAGLRPLVAAGGGRSTQKLIRDHEVEIDPASGLISILGGKWTTHRAMAEDTIDAVQRQLGQGKTPSLTREHPLMGAAGYHPEYWRELMSRHHLEESTACHLARKYGTQAEQIAGLAAGSPELLQPLVPGAAPIRAEAVYGARVELARTVEDVLARRIGLQLYSWELALQAAPTVAGLLAAELRWTAAQRQQALADYQQRIQHLQQVAGLARSVAQS